MKLLIFLLTFLYSGIALSQTVRSSGDNVVDRTLGKNSISLTTRISETHLSSTITATAADISDWTVTGLTIGNFYRVSFYFDSSSHFNGPNLNIIFNGTASNGGNKYGATQDDSTDNMTSFTFKADTTNFYVYAVILGNLGIGAGSYMVFEKLN